MKGIPSLGEVVGVDLDSRSVDADCPGIGIKKVGFDYLVIAAGMQSSYFGHDEFAKYAPCLKTITDAEAIRSKVLSAYELAESTDDEDERRRQMTFVLVGAGPTGVELAASLAQMATTTLRRNFRRIDPATTMIFLLDGAKRILPSFAELLSKKAAERLAKLGVQVITGAMVESIDARGVTVGGKLIPCGAVLWTAGVSPSPLVKMLGVATDRAGRACVGPFLSVPDTPNVFVVGDTATLVQNGKPLPGVAQVAIQQGRYVGRLISRELSGRKPPRPFRYFDKGNMAVVGKNFAIMKTRHIRLAGFTAVRLGIYSSAVSAPVAKLASRRAPMAVELSHRAAQLTSGHRGAADREIADVGATTMVSSVSRRRATVCKLSGQRRLRVRTQWFWSYYTGQRSSRLISELPWAETGEPGH